MEIKASCVPLKGFVSDYTLLCPTDVREHFNLKPLRNNVPFNSFPVPVKLPYTIFAL